MSTMKQELLMLKGAIADLTDEQQSLIKVLKAEIRRLTISNGQEGFLALTLAGLEMAVEEE